MVEKMTKAAKEAARRAVDEIAAIEKAEPYVQVGKERKAQLTPGNIIDDFTYIPEFMETRSGEKIRVSTHREIRGQMRILTPDGTGIYRWITRENVPLHKRRGFRFTHAERFAGTDEFELGPDQIVRNGDLMLMEIQLDAYDKMRAEKLRMDALYQRVAESDLAHEGSTYGVETFRELPDGTRERIT